jgi:hypothetical protein
MEKYIGYMSADDGNVENVKETLNMVGEEEVEERRKPRPGRSGSRY